MKLTPWFSNGETPVREGWYNATVSGDADVRRWWFPEHKEWGAPVWVGDPAAYWDSAKSRPREPEAVVERIVWRGVLQ